MTVGDVVGPEDVLEGSGGSEADDEDKEGEAEGETAPEVGSVGEDIGLLGVSVVPDDSVGLADTDWS